MNALDEIQVAIERRARTAVAQLETVSHGKTANYDPSSHSVDGPERPPGGISRQDDHEADHPQKSHLAFVDRLRQADTIRAYARIAQEAEAALDAWRRAPITGEPEYGSAQWKRWVALSDEPSAKLAARFGVTARYINMVRQKYRDTK